MDRKQFKAVAEWAEQESILLTWPIDEFSWKNHSLRDIFVTIVKELAPVVKVQIQALGSDHDAVKAILSANDVQMENVELLDFDPDTVILRDGDPGFDPRASISWPRDYGAEVVMNDDGERAVISFDKAIWNIGNATKYDREAAITECFPRWHAKVAGVDNVLFTRLISEGGDREFNGAGVLLTTEETELSKRNPQYTKEEFEKEMYRLAGIEKILWVPRGTYDDEDCCVPEKIPGPDNTYSAYRLGGANCHMDEMARFVNENTILLGYIDDEEAERSLEAKVSKERYDEAYEYLSKQTNLDGKPFNIVRIPVPEVQYLTEDFRKNCDCLLGLYASRPLETAAKDEQGEVTFLAAASYTNFIISNKKVLAQQYYWEGLPEIIKQKDEEAIRVLKECFPDREVVGINTYALNILGGGIHCSTRQIPKSVKKA